MIVNYFKILEEENTRLLETIDKIKIRTSEYFPIFGFSKVCPKIVKIPKLKKQQKEKLNKIVGKKGIALTKEYRTPDEVINDTELSKSHQDKQIIYSIMNGSMDLEEVKEYLQGYSEEKSTSYRQILCAYDYKKYAEEEV